MQHHPFYVIIVGIYNVFFEGKQGYLFMIRVREILALEPLAEFKLLAGAGGLDHMLNNVTILDYETDSMDFSAFQKGDFILTSLFFAKDDPSLITDAFRALLRRGIAGIAVKTVFYKALPQDMLRLADAMNVPVFTYHTAFMEDIILAIHAYMLAKEQRTLAVMRLDALLGLGRAPSAIAESVRALDAMLYPHCIAAFATPRKEAAAQVPQKLAVPASGGQYTAFYPYQGGVLALYTAAEQGRLAGAEEALIQAYTACGMDPAAWRIGISSPCHAYDAFDAAIRESLYANRVCRCLNASCLSYAALGVYRFLPALLEDKSALAQLHSALARLKQFEAETGIPLLSTLAAYTAAHGSVEQAAKQIFQHPNTVRNRVKKARALLSLGEDWYEELFILMGMHALENA